ncbi:MAG: helix-turn-helix transcriptional regulator [Burkholderiales bacterium]|nr:helix-turn-helix transcriptional regulator [Burkholderiales bacterium]
MQTIQELGEAVAARRHALKLRQAAVATQAGITAESLSRFERGRSAEFGARKLLAVLAVLGMELDVVVAGQSGTLDELRLERNSAGTGVASGTSTAVASTSGAKRS